MRAPLLHAFDVGRFVLKSLYRVLVRYHILHSTRNLIAHNLKKKNKTKHSIHQPQCNSDTLVLF